MEGPRATLGAYNATPGEQHGKYLTVAERNDPPVQVDADQSLTASVGHSTIDRSGRHEPTSSVEGG